MAGGEIPCSSAPLFSAEMMGLAGDIGAKQLLLRHRDRVTEVEIASDGIFADIDAAPDLARLKKLRSKS